MNPFLSALRTAAAALLLLLGSMSVAPAATEITAILWITNTPAGLSTNLVVNAGTADTRYWTNNPSATNSVLIQVTNTTAASRTNLLVHLSSYPVYSAGSGTPQVSVSYNATNTSALNLTAPDNTNLTVTANGTWARVTYFTNTYVDSAPILNRTNAMSHRERTNAANAIANFLNLAVTNPVAAAASALTNFVNLYAAQNLSNKTIMASVVDGPRLTNVVAIHGTNGTLVAVTFLLGTYDGTISALSNGTLYSTLLSSNRITNAAALHGTLFRLQNGVLTNVAFDRGFSTNLQNYGYLYAFGSGPISLLIGSNSTASATNTVTVGNNSANSSMQGTLVGNSSTMSGHAASGLGFSLNIQGDYAGGIGAFGSATANRAFALQGGTASEEYAFAGFYATASGYNSWAWGDEDTIAGGPFSIAFAPGAVTDGVGGMALGWLALNSFSNSLALGPADDGGNRVITTTTNQLRAGTPRQVLSVPGFIQGTVSNLVTAPGQTNVINGDLSFSTATIASVANGANRLNIGTNVVVYLTGAPSLNGWSVDGIIAGGITPRGGQLLELDNRTGYNATFVHNSGLETTEAYRISTATSTNMIFTNGAIALLRYNASAQRWVLRSVFSGHDLAARATNAVGWLDGSATNLHVWQTAGGTGLVVHALPASGQPALSVLSSNGTPQFVSDSNGISFAQAITGQTNDAFQLRITNGVPVVTFNSSGVFGTSNIQARGGITIDGVSVLTNSAGYVLFLGSAGGNNFADSTTYYFGGDLNANLNTTYTLASVEVPKAGTLRRAFVKVRVIGTLATTEAVSTYVRLNDTTDVTIDTSATFDTVSTNIVGTMSQAVAAGDLLTLKIATPAWVTNPTTVRVFCYLFIE